MRSGFTESRDPCPECRATWECFCKCRNRMRLVAREIEAMEAVIDQARPVARSGAALLAEALAAFDAAVEARKGAP